MRFIVRNKRSKYALFQNSHDLHEILFNSLFLIVKGVLIFLTHYTPVVRNIALCIIAFINVVMHAISTNNIHPQGAWDSDLGLIWIVYGVHFSAYFQASVIRAK